MIKITHEAAEPREVYASFQFAKAGLEMIICDDEGNIKDRTLFDLEDIVKEHLPYHFVRNGVFNTNKDNTTYWPTFLT
jgi:hypothetical protein